MRTRVFWLVCILWFAFFLLTTACQDSPMSASVIPQEEVIVNAIPGNEGGDDEAKGCEVINITARRSDGDNRVILKVEPSQTLDRLYAKFLVEDGGLVRIVHIERSLQPFTRTDITVLLPKCGVEYQVFVYVEGTIGDKLYQCDGSVNLTMKCEEPPPPPPQCVQPPRPGENCTWNEALCQWECLPPPPPPCPPTGEPECPEQTWDPVTCSWVGDCEEECIEIPCGECQTWNPVTCACEGECPPPDCIIPPEHNFSMSRSIGNPAAECGLFDLSASGDTPVIYITKCGLFYEVTHNPWTSGQCSNGQDVSHSTPCYCPEE